MSTMWVSIARWKQKYDNLSLLWKSIFWGNVAALAEGVFTLLLDYLNHVTRFSNSTIYIVCFLIALLIGSAFGAWRQHFLPTRKHPERAKWIYRALLLSSINAVYSMRFIVLHAGTTNWARYFGEVTRIVVNTYFFMGLSVLLLGVWYTKLWRDRPRFFRSISGSFLAFFVVVYSLLANAAGRNFAIRWNDFFGELIVSLFICLGAGLTVWSVSGLMRISRRDQNLNKFQL